MSATVLPRVGITTNQILDYTRETHVAFPFQRSAKGGSGLTYLSKDPYFQWVIKWQSKLQGECEHLCTAFYQRVFEHYSVPHTMLVTDQSIRDALSTFFSKNGVQVANIHYPLFMQFLKGNNLERFCGNGNLFHLGPADLCALFTAFGSVAGYDLIIGNSDRFFPRDFRGTVDPKHTVNSGNIMVQVDSDHILKFVHLIDNAPHFDYFFGYEERKAPELSEEEFLEGSFTMFDTKSASADESSSSSADEVVLPSGRELRKLRTADFRFYIHASSEELMQIVMQIRIGIENDLSKLEDGKYTDAVSGLFNSSETSKVITEGLLEGLIHARGSMGRETLSPVIAELEQMHWEERTTLILLDFIKTNINYVQQLNSNI